MYHTRYTENKLNWSEFEHGRDELNPIFSLQIHGKFYTLNDYNDRASRMLLNFKYIIRWMVGENRSFTAHYVCVCGASVARVHRCRHCRHRIKTKGTCLHRFHLWLHQRINLITSQLKKNELTNQAVYFWIDRVTAFAFSFNTTFISLSIYIS